MEIGKIYTLRKSTKSFMLDFISLEVAQNVKEVYVVKGGFVKTDKMALLGNGTFRNDVNKIINYLYNQHAKNKVDIKCKIAYVNEENRKALFFYC